MANINEYGQRGRNELANSQLNAMKKLPKTLKSAT